MHKLLKMLHKKFQQPLLPNTLTHVVLGQWTFSFVDLNQHTRLVVRIGGERLRLLGGDGGVPLDEGGHHTSGRLDTHGQRGNVQQQQVLDLAGLVSGQDGSLDSCYTK